jgi:hypothetical protein
MWDLMGNYRLWDGDLDGDTIVDMGAYEFASVGVGAEEFRVSGSGFRVEIFPNPADEYTMLHVTLSDISKLDISLYNVAGECLRSWDLSQTQSGQLQVKIDLGGLPGGVYILHVRSGHDMATGKIIKL